MDLPSNANAIIYNEHSTGTGTKVVRWLIKHVLPDVWWEEKEGVNVIRSGLTAANSTEVIMTKRDGYVTPLEWRYLTTDEALSGNFYTLKESDRMIRGDHPNAPATFGSVAEVDAYFTPFLSHTIMSVDQPVTPGGVHTHFEIGCK